MAFLFEELNTLKKFSASYKDFPSFIAGNLNPEFELRPYQKEAFQNFITYFETSTIRKNSAQTLFHMATGSGKTLIMAGLILYLYKQGYRNFLFFVHLDNIVQKTKENFLNSNSSKYLFNDTITIDGEKIAINETRNFENSASQSINICFTTIQGLHSDLWTVKENALSFEDFADKKIVFISDEAHHLNADTKKGGKSVDEDVKTWEETITRIFKQNTDNVLLEFTATCDIENNFIRALYEDKIIFDYPLKNFRRDKYSKEVVSLASDTSLMDRAMQALLLSQYRLKVFQENRLDIKPVVLFKSAKIEDSKNFMSSFLEQINNLSGKDLKRIAMSGTSEVLKEMYQFYTSNDISFNQLADELKKEFGTDRCISVNDTTEALQKQIIVNSLEDKNNPYRAVFEVKKLDEGWDCLNLFDIVRLYETRDAKGNKPGTGTVAEAQLIGRGARYCPFQLNEEQAKYQRKYDDDKKNSLRVCETLYYHCQNDSRYISEIKTALQETGMLDFNGLDFSYELKPDFKKSDFYKKGIVFANKRQSESRKNVHELLPSLRTAEYNIRTVSGNISEDMLLGSGHKEEAVKTYFHRTTIKEIATANYSIVHQVLRRVDAFKFDRLKTYFPNIETLKDFITNENYLGNIKLVIESDTEQLNAECIRTACMQALQEIGLSISSIEETYTGTKEFFEYPMPNIFKDKSMSVSELADQSVGVSQNDPKMSAELRLDLSGKSWFAFNDNYGTTEEKAFVKYFDTWGHL
ncbi:MAG: DEAD/DEAH box helicase family protein [Termitinemataceae bacterium]|nr:MAG: DEAD/DEAH box helicase family protein [Termitinemataceae bacterium]